jgi:DNA repair photolyase
MELIGRGAASNPRNRFESLDYQRDEDADPSEEIAPQTFLYKDASRSALTSNDSPDIPFTHSLNPYRGCEHGCVYCYARPTHEYLGMSSGLDFETRIMVKENAPELLRKELSAKKWVPDVVVMSGVTDCYQPAERKLLLTRRCLEVFAEFRNPVAVITKNALIERDADIFAELSKYDAGAACLSITTLDPDLARRLEPRASAPYKRLKAVETLAKAGAFVSVNAAPLIPGLNDHELPAILKAAADAGAKAAGYTLVRLPYSVAPLFEQWLDRHYPDRKDKVLSQIRALRGGKLNDSRFGTRFSGEGNFAANVEGLFRLASKQAGLGHRRFSLSTAHFRRPSGPQLELF